MYVLFTIIPFIDPKKKIQFMGKKYQSLKFVFTLLMSALAMIILYSMKEQSMTSPNLIIIGVGLLFIALGNYMKTIND